MKVYYFILSIVIEPRGCKKLTTNECDQDGMCKTSGGESKKNIITFLKILIN